LSENVTFSLKILTDLTDEKCRHPLMVADPMNICQDYYVANSILDALKALTNTSGHSLIIAGGTDILLDIQQGRHPPVHTLVDITEIPEMTALEIRGEELFIGAAVLHRTINTSQLISEHCYALGIASGLIGGPQVRNTATIGGNVSHALPAADGTIALIALDADAEIAGNSGRKRIPIAELFLGPGKSTLYQNQEILIGFYVELRKPGQASAFRRIMRPQGVAIAILNLAVWLQRKGDFIDDIRIAVGPSGPVPRRMMNTEAMIREKPLTDKNFHQAYQALLKEAIFRTSRHRATKEYREKIAGVLLKETLFEAFKRSQVDEK
jgi:carbon-monoxide dehydrogenase medium subunit